MDQTPRQCKTSCFCWAWRGKRGGKQLRTRQGEKERVDCSWSWHEPGFVQAWNALGTELFPEPSKKSFRIARSEGEAVNQEHSPVESEEQPSLCP